MSGTTLEYYDQNCASFTSNTIDVKFTDIQDKFLGYLKPVARILDFGCGSGRDSKYFLSKGYEVEACDGSQEMVRIASQTAGIPVRQMLFGELEEVERYDGIFACASILHVPSAELPDILSRMLRAVKKGGILYISFKYGTFEGMRKGRYFTDLTEERMETLLSKACGARITLPKSCETNHDGQAAIKKDLQEDSERNRNSESPVQILDSWITGDARPGRESEKWLNVILRRTA